MTPIDKVRAALEIGKKYWQAESRSFDRVGFSRHRIDADLEIINEALSELDGMVLVPVEPTKKQLKGMFEAVGMVRQSSDLKRTYKAGISPYVKGE